MRVSGAIFLFALLLSGCGPDATHVAGPFYLTYIKNPRETSLFRCVDQSTESCAGDGLPGPTIFAAGANEKYVVVVRHPYKDGSFDRNRMEYFYFARVKEELHGWGENPEKIIGPLNEVAFLAAKNRYHLPDFSVRPSDLE